MTTYEIIQMYKEAKDKNAQIEILADLACCSKEDILFVLQNAGLISGVPGEKKKKKAATYQKSGAPRLVWDEELKQTVRSLLMEGMTCAAIAERIGWDTAQVQYGISRYKLRGEAKKKEPAEKKEEPAVKTGTPQTLAFEGEEEEQRIKRELSNEESDTERSLRRRVSLMRDYARCITLLSKESLANYEAIVGVFAESIIQGADGILREAAEYGV